MKSLQDNCFLKMVKCLFNATVFQDHFGAIYMFYVLCHYFKVKGRD